MQVPLWCCMCIVNSYSNLLKWPIVSLLFLFIFFSMFFVLIHDYTLCFNGSPCCKFSYYNYISIWPYYIVIHLSLVNVLLAIDKHIQYSRKPCTTAYRLNYVMVPNIPLPLVKFKRICVIFGNIVITCTIMNQFVNLQSTTHSLNSVWDINYVSLKPAVHQHPKLLLQNPYSQEM